MTITKEKFEDYRRCQVLGLHNMLDYNAWKSITYLTKAEWFEIVKNYNKYKEQYEH